MTNIRKIVNAESLKEIRNLNISLVVLAFPCMILMLFLIEEHSKEIFVIAMKTSTYMFITSNLLMLILKQCAKKYSDDLFKFRLYRYILSYATGISIYLTLWPIFAKLAHIDPRLDDYELLAGFTAMACLLTTFILFLHDFVVYRYNRRQTEIEVSLLQLRTSQAENLLLKQQIHPHFLFNSLNTLKALIKKDPALSEIYLIQLADFLRSAVSHNNSQTATLRDELRFCKNYLEMQKIRFGSAIDWEVVIVDDEILEGLLPVFSLQPLLENAIKHNIFTKESPLKLIIQQNGENIVVSNIINYRNAGETSTQSGLSNLAERYNLWSGEEIIIKNDGITFSVSFKIIKNEDRNH
ncbi:sensor histidine kinase [Flavobacterium hercynium]|uniref:Signal transduction histidine kinase internal region domain-containing protein n=1 Tax=Flavobacterium hercynium TaxID=387094 RepID=A0A226HJW3_9FLAO|nr:histidine kinase [Flavobacterium hercynium]OXA93770.1 hypothetical protein B0A66_05830 [Flavobacterium hercynium]SMP20482.1 Histidine kinase [Flavobacterium hercynium]